MSILRAMSLDMIDTMSEYVTEFIARVKEKCNTESVTEIRCLFDNYETENTIKQITNQKRLQNTNTVARKYSIHKLMSLKHVTKTDLLSHHKTKDELTKYLANELILHYKDSEIGIIVSCGRQTLSNRAGLIDDSLLVHGHTEADQLFPLHVLDIQKREESHDIDIACPDTDVSVAILDLVANHHITGNIKVITGHGNFNAAERVMSLGDDFCKALIGLHNVSGSDWGGAFAGISKKRFWTVFRNLSENDDIRKTLTLLGTSNTLSQVDMDNFERFICLVYSNDTKFTHVKDLRWHLFRSQNFEGEKLPPTMA